MIWKLLTLFAFGITAGLIISNYLPARIQYKGKFKQKGQNNTMTIKKEKEPRKRRLTRRNKHKQ